MTKAHAAELLGTAMLLIGVVGSGIMAEALADGNVAIALLANTIATGCVLYVIITILGPISGAHFNPVVSVAFALRGDLPWPEAARFILFQVVGGILGVWLAHLMFDLSILQLGTAERASVGRWSAEILATFGLLMVIFGGIRHRPEAVPTLVALYITGAYWFTASTSFANPAVTIARSFSDTFAGILPAHAPAFILCQIIGMGLALVVARRLFD